MASRIEINHVTPPPVEAVQANGLFTKIRKAVEFSIDCLIMICYLIKHTLYWLISDQSGKESVFKGKVICRTHNYAKLSELWDYVKLRRKPLVFPEETKVFANRKGFTESRTHIWTKPHTNGFCQGGVITFCKEWFKTHDIHKVAEHLDGGIPIRGAVYQQVYTTWFKDEYYPYLVEKIREYIDHYPQIVHVDSEFSDAHVIFEGLQAYLKEFCPEDGDMAEWVRKWAFENRKLSIGGFFYASLREAARYYNKKKYSGRDLTCAIYEFSRLKSETLCFDASPRAVLEAVTSLSPGVYNTVLPTYGTTGNKKSPHSVAIIREGEFFYFYDPNNAIAYSPCSEGRETVGRIFQKYTGFDYSQNLNGSSPGFLEQIMNFFQERATPPTTPLFSGFDLYRITPLNNN